MKNVEAKSPPSKTVTFDVEIPKTAAEREIINPFDKNGKILLAQNSSVRMSKSWNVVEHVPEMHESNVKALKASYRHPFEYISPNLYKKNATAGTRPLTTANLFVENEDEFHS